MSSATASARQRSTLTVRYRMAVLSRVAAAVIGGYLLTTTLSLLLARVMDSPRAEAVATALLLSFAIYIGAIIWAFAARTVCRAWIGLLLPAVVSFAAWWLAAA